MSFREDQQKHRDWARSTIPDWRLTSTISIGCPMELDAGSTASKTTTNTNPTIRRSIATRHVTVSVDRQPVTDGADLLYDQQLLPLSFFFFFSDFALHEMTSICHEDNHRLLLLLLPPCWPSGIEFMRVPRAKTTQENGNDVINLANQSVKVQLQSPPVELYDPERAIVPGFMTVTKLSSKNYPMNYIIQLYSQKVCITKKQFQSSFRAVFLKLL